MRGCVSVCLFVSRIAEKVMDGFFNEILRNDRLWISEELNKVWKVRVKVRFSAYCTC